METSIMGYTQSLHNGYLKSLDTLNPDLGLDGICRG